MATDAEYESGPSDVLKIERHEGRTSTRFWAFDTQVDIVIPEEGHIAEKALAACFDACRRYEGLFSRTRRDSDVSRLNSSQGAWVALDRDTYSLIEQALRYCRDSLGYFDITMGAVCRLWDFKAHLVPSRSSLEEALSHVDWRTIDLRRDESAKRCWCRLSDPQAYLDLGGIAKGWISDRLGERVEEEGFGSYAISLGGNVKVKGGRVDGTPWKVGVRDPSRNESIVGTLAMHDGAAITSGSCERRFVKDGVVYHHILDPKNGFPVVSDISSVTVIADSGMDAEGWSTTLFALGRKQAGEFIATRPEITAALFVLEDGTVDALDNRASGSRRANG